MLTGDWRNAGKRNDEENAKEKLYTYASHVPVDSFKVRTVPCLFLPYSANVLTTRVSRRSS